MSRNGFLLCRHGTPNNGANNPVPTRVGLFRGQPASLARARRIDEIMFFVEGRYASAREPAHPSLVARSSQARVYYGHGTVSPEIPASSNFHFTNAGAFGNPNELAGRLGQPGLPNAFASDWILLRHQTLLALPRTAPGDFPTTDSIWGPNPQPANGRRPHQARRQDRQIRLQPAAASIFRAMNRPPQSQDFNQYPAQGGWRRPGQLLFSSGLVDIATSDLAEVRAYVMQMHNGAPGAEEPIFPWTNPPSPAPVGVTLPVPQSYTPRLPDALAGPGNQQRLLYNMHAWSATRCRPTATPIRSTPPPRAPSGPDPHPQPDSAVNFPRSSRTSARIRGPPDAAIRPAEQRADAARVERRAALHGVHRRVVLRRGQPSPVRRSGTAPASHATPTATSGRVDWLHLLRLQLRQ